MDAEVTANQMSGPSPIYQAASKPWGMASTASIVVAALSVVLLSWFFLSTRSAQRSLTDLENQSAQLDSQIATADKFNDSTYDAKATELLDVVTQFQKISNGRSIWSKLLPAVSNSTLQGVTLAGIAIDDKQLVKLDAVSSGATIGADQFTPYGMAARQVVAYRDMVLADPSIKDATKAPKMFSHVTLTAITQVQPKDDKSASVARFSVSFTLNPDLVKLPVVVPTQTKSTAPATTPAP